ncbi:Putative S-adenosyl-L-methionine-dependent methyltransferase superfamily [Colletotrichum destructivum]|uniref:S-adenosyl-L-methionine-dependent methyltransferase superfamily n=1 Tax=Colletotrichum destructivum TaxID=34406 RepID=A0AAX4IRG1_9PEZI|nr:Putative S-adenosyl-L-methionine-dependent methyltransferase superfamily [Colletotrichum destructivum]
MSTSPNPVTESTGVAGSNAPAAGPAQGPITIDPNIEANGDDESEAETRSIVSSSTASLADSITEYRRLHGRTYTQKVDYWGPNDEKQNEGLDINHYCMTMFLGDKLFLSPVGKTSHMVLDVGTGTGIWAIDFADEFPSAEVIGVDVSPIQPGWVPPNCKFQIDDIEQPWTWPADYFDFIHIRNLEGCVSDWQAVYEQAYRCTKPGGYIEVKEHDIQIRSQIQDLGDKHIYNTWIKALLDAIAKLGKVGLQCRDHGIAKNLEAAGFVDVVENKWPVPVGPWANNPLLKEVGICSLQFMDQSLEGFGTFLLKEVMGWEYAEILVAASEVRKALKDPRLQTVFDLHLVYARKPGAGADSGADTES